MDLAAPEQTAAAGSDLLIQRGLIARPAIGGGTRKRKGGFFPSVMGGVVDAGMLTGPLVALTARRMLSRKTRKGGGKKGNLWQRNRNEARAILETYGKPTALNIQQYAVAKRRGTDPAEEFLEGYRKRKQEQDEKEMARKAAIAKRKANKETKKAEKEAEKALKQAAKEASRAYKKEVKETAKAMKKAEKEKAKANRAATKKVKAPKKAVKEVSPENEAFWKTLLNEAKPKTPEAPKPKTPNAPKKAAAPSNASQKYFQALREARTYLGTIGAPTGPNMSKYASMKLKGQNTSEWEENFKTRRPLTMAKATTAAVAVKANKPKTPKNKTAKAVTTNKPKTPKNKTAKVKKTAAPATNKAVAKTNKNQTAKAKKPAVKNQTAKVKPASTAGPKSQAYFQALRNARTYLASIGAPTGPNMSKYASMKLKGENTSEWEENFKTRRPLSMATEKKAKKTKTTAAPQKKALTAVQEANETENEENEMQGYSENFESEPESEK